VSIATRNPQFIMPRFVILEHDHPFLHWDFMLEASGVLRTWRLASAPVAGAVISATPLGDHRLAYLDYHGPLSGNRGSVQRWDHGDYNLLTDSGAIIVVELSGEQVRGKATLTSTSAGQWVWTFAAAG
jgi:hypothetical protein